MAWRNKWLPLLLIAGASSGSGEMISSKKAPTALPTVMLKGGSQRHSFLPMLRRGGQLLAGVPRADGRLAYGYSPL